MAFNHIHSLTSIKESAITKIALGSASVMMLTIVGSTGIASATSPVQTPEASASSQQTMSENVDKQSQDKRNDTKTPHDNRDGEKNNKGNHGYGGGNNNAVRSNTHITQNGHDNILSVIINYIFN